MSDPANRRDSSARWLAVLVVVLWAACFGLNIHAVVRGSGFSPLLVAGADTADGYPVVRGFRPYLAADKSGLRVGDRLVRLGNADLRGVGPLGFFAIFAEQAGDAASVPVEFERAGLRATVGVQAASVAMFAALLPASFVFACVAVLLHWWARPSPLVRALFACFMSVALHFAANFFGSRLATYAAIVIHVASIALVGPFALRALFLFPESRRTEDAAPAWPWLFAILGLPHTGHFGWPVPAEIGEPAAALIVVVLLTACLLVVTRAYRRADPIGRRQIKWFCFGLYCAATPIIVTAALAAAHPGFGGVYFMSLAATAAIPIALFISIARYNLFDIDRLISSTASSNVLLALAVTVGTTLIPRTAEATADVLGVDPWVGRLALSATLGLCVVALHRQLRRNIDRLFFAGRYALETGVQRLLVELSGCQDPRVLTKRMSEGLNQLLRPEACVVYARGDDSYTPLFVEGRAVPPGFEREGPLIATLRERQGPIAFEEHGRRVPVMLSPFERAVLETLDAAVVLPIWRNGVLFLLFCLGPKRSGDVYTPTDLGLLATVADKVSGELERFGQAEVIRQSRSMQEALRRYVPDVVAEALDTGRDLEPVEREITVLFVDLRGYTAYCEPREPHEIFATTNRYAATVSAVIRRHGGAIVEFSGDGLMATFGAPEPLAGKEAAAVRAAHDLGSAVAELGASSPDADPFSVGVGIATGTAVVGNIRSADRLIWTAVGNKVNLAARLQALTRELDALVAIDAETYAAAGDAARGFRRCSNVSIRGRRAPEDVYVLPINSQAAAA